jgi:thioredoxin reductase
MTKTPEKIYDVTVIGAGPVGLFAVFYAGMRKMSINLMDSLAQAGGQLSALYPEKYIYDMPGFPEVRAKRLVEELFQQTRSANPNVHLSRKVTKIESFPSQTECQFFKIHTESGETFSSKTVILALGMGAFRPRKLEADGLAELEGKGVHYVLKPLAEYKGKDVLVIGGGDSAADWTLAMAKPGDDGSALARSTTQIHRGGKFTAHEATIEEISRTGARVKTNYELKNCRALPGGRIHAVLENNLNKTTEEINVDEIIICIGYVAKLDFVKESGITMQGNSIVVNERMETNIPGIFACGDVVNHGAKLKLIATGVGEAAIAANFAKVRVDPAAKAFPGHSTSLMGKEVHA